MKTKLFIGLFLLAVTIKASSQDFRLVIQGGANMGKIDGKAIDDEFKKGFHLGITPEIMFTPKFGVHPGVFFNQSNTQTSTNFEDVYKLSANDFKGVRLNYLSVPLLLAFKPIPLLTFQAGPQFSILMSKDKTFLENGKSSFKNGDLSMVGGVQVNLLRLRVYGRYGVGLSNIGDIGSQEKWRSQTAQLGVGLAL